jgi:YD repeat-containing protein
MGHRMLRTTQTAVLAALTLIAVKKVSAQQQIIYNYDELNRLVQIGYGPNTTVAYRYDANGNILSRTIDQADELDMDGDGVADSSDNCLNDPNPDQLDTDGDGLGDVCDDDDDNDGLPDGEDQFPLDPSRTGVDSDADGVEDLLDNCVGNANPGQANFDGDLLGDACDEDDDNDQLTDSEENALGTDPLNPDSDGDGYSDGEEVEWETSPLDATDIPARPGLSPIIIWKALQE